MWNIKNICLRVNQLLTFQFWMKLRFVTIHRPTKTPQLSYTLFPLQPEAISEADHLFSAGTSGKLPIQCQYQCQFGRPSANSRSARALRDELLRQIEYLCGLLREHRSLLDGWLLFQVALGPTWCGFLSRFSPSNQRWMITHLLLLQAHWEWFRLPQQHWLKKWVFGVGAKKRV